MVLLIGSSLNRLNDLLNPKEVSTGKETNSLDEIFKRDGIQFISFYSEPIKRSNYHLAEEM